MGTKEKNEKARLIVELSDGVEKDSAQDILTRITKLDRYIEKINIRIKLRQTQLDRKSKITAKEKVLLDSGLELFDLNKKVQNV
jgi:hypothetical protein